MGLLDERDSPSQFVVPRRSERIITGTVPLGVPEVGPGLASHGRGLVVNWRRQPRPLASRPDQLSNDARVTNNPSCDLRGTGGGAASYRSHSFTSVTSAMSDTGCFAGGDRDVRPMQSRHSDRS